MTITKEEKLKLAAQIKCVRKESGYTQKDLASKIGVSRAAIASYEIARNRPDVAILAAIGKACNCKIDDIINIPVENIEKNIN